MQINRLSSVVRYGAALAALAGLTSLGCSSNKTDVAVSLPEKTDPLKTPGTGKQAVDYAMQGRPRAGDDKSAPAVPDPEAAKQPTEEELGLPIYPGAKPYVGPGGAKVSLGRDSGAVTGLFETGDGLNDVRAFYERKLKPMAGDEEFKPLVDTTSKQRKVSFSIPEGNSGLKMVSIREETEAGSVKTVIQLMHILPRQMEDAPAMPTDTGAVDAPRSKFPSADEIQAGPFGNRRPGSGVTAPPGAKGVKGLPDLHLPPSSGSAPPPNTPPVR